MTRIVTGIGTRNPPDNDSDLTQTLDRFCLLATQMGWLLRSGAAVGMDTEFERRWNANKEIFIHSTVVGRRRHGVNGAIYVDNPAATTIALGIHPNPRALRRNDTALALHTRNIFQVLGSELIEPSDIVVYYAKLDGDSILGGTRTAVELAKRHKINHFNLILPDERKRLIAYVVEEYDRFKNVGNVGS